jgi:hypothetical protein
MSIFMVLVVLDFVKAFERNNRVVSDHSSRHEGALSFRNDIIKEWSKTVNQAFGDNFVDHIA